MGLLGRRHWIFDLDGTLTVAVHDFEAIRRALGLPAGVPVLEAIAREPAARAAALLARLDLLEHEYAARAEPQAGARALLEGLHGRAARLGIVTRNSGSIARATLDRCGLLDLFDPDCIVGREAATPKPSPAGVRRLLEAWSAEPEDAVMVGDFQFDLRAGRDAGTATVYVDFAGEARWCHLADVHVPSLGALAEMAGAG